MPVRVLALPLREPRQELSQELRRDRAPVSAGKPVGQQHSEGISLRFTPGELALVRAQARIAGVSLSAYIRDMVAGQPPVGREVLPLEDQPRPEIGPDVGDWRKNKVAHVVLLFASGAQEQAYRRWLEDPASYDAFGQWFDAQGKLQ
jgi:hypothetical protein